MLNLSEIKPGDVLFIGFLIIVAIAVIYFAFFYKRDEGRRNSYKSKQQKSGGTADKAAIDALDEIKEIRQPNEEDNYNAGRIEELNILEGNIDNARERPEIIHDIIDRFIGAVDRIHERRYDRQIRARLDPEVHLAEGIGDDAGGDFVIAPEVMVAHIGNFALGGLDFILGQVEGGDDFWAPVIPPFQMMALGAYEAGENLREERLAVAANATQNKEDFAKTYLASTVTHTSDPQNVHDSSVNEDLKATLRELRRTSSKTPAAVVLSQIDKYIGDAAARAVITTTTALNARETLKTAKLGAYISQYEETEDNILKYVWERTNLPDNQDNSDNMKDCIVKALADCIDVNTGVTVCAGGRASRYLESLVLQDYNPKVGTAQRQEEYKNQILSEVAHIVDSEIERAVESDDEEMRKVGQSYKDPAVEVNEDVAEKLRERMRKRIVDHISTYKEHFKPYQLEELKKDCIAAVL